MNVTVITRLREVAYSHVGDVRVYRDGAVRVVDRRRALLRVRAYHPPGEAVRVTVDLEPADGGATA